MTLPLPQIEGKYEILHKIKEGGMGSIYKVRHRLLEEVRVVKTIRPQFAEDADLRERFLREAKTAIRLRHPGIAQLYDFSVDSDGTAYIVMEYIDGVTLQEMVVKGGPLPVPLTLEVSRQALEALSYLHHKGFVHRDVAPDNLMLTRTFDGLPQVKLIDLGIAKRLEGAGVDLTATGTFLGKVRYAAPEQFSDSGGSGIGPRSDVYSFGVMLYELLTGRLPFRGENIHELMAGHLFRPPLGFDETDPEGRVPEPLREAVLHALTKEPEERIASAEELATRLAPLLSGRDELREDLDRTLHTTATLLVEREEVEEPGSTQGRLAEQFGPEPTPRPEPSKPARRPRRIETRNQEIAALLANAQLLARLEQYDRAKHELDRLLDLDPDSRDGRELLESVEGALANRREAARKRAEEAERKREEEARRKAEAERKRAEEEAKRRAEEEARRKAEEEERKRAEEEARRKAEEEAQKKAEEEARRRAEALERAAAAVEDLVSRGELDEAERRLEAVREELGDDTALKSAEKAIEKRRKEAEKLLGRARKAAGKDPEKAQQLLWEVLDLVPAHEEAQELLEEVVAAIRERELERAVAEAVRSITGRITDGELDRAEEELDFARGSYGERPEIEEVSETLERARAAAEALRREEEERARRQAEEEKEARKRAEEEEARRRAEEEARKKAEEEERKRAEEAARKRAEEEERRKAEEEARKEAEAEEARKRAEEEEEARRREAEEAEEEAAREEAADATVLMPREEAPEEESPPVEPVEPEEEAAPAPEPARDQAPVEPDAAAEDRRSIPRWAWGLAAGLALLLAGALVWSLLPSSPAEDPDPAGAVADRGYLVLDALPWAEVTEIRDAEGELVPLDGPRHTPVRLALPPGTYTVSMANPNAPEPVSITAEIEAWRSTERVVEMGKVDADEYLEGVGL